MQRIPPTWYYEDVKERIGDVIISNTLSPATVRQMALARRLHARGCCPHTIVQDEPGYMYDYRSCAICGAGLGVI